MIKKNKLLALVFITLVSSCFVFLQTLKADTQPLKVQNIVVEESLLIEEVLWDNSEYECLVKNIYFEAGIEPSAGKIAVAMVTINRVISDRYPDTICGVVTQGPISKWHLENTGKEIPIRNRCQFSWWCDGKSDDPYYGEEWTESEDIAYKIYYNYLHDKITLDITEGSMYYHADYVNPHWASSMHKVVKIGTHIFYR